MHLLSTRMRHDGNKPIQLVESWKMTLDDEVTDVVTRATLNTVLYVADEMKGQFYFHGLVKCFCCVHRKYEQSQTEYVLEIGEDTVNYTTRWLFLEPFTTYKMCTQEIWNSYFSERWRHFDKPFVGIRETTIDSMYTAVDKAREKQAM